MDEAVIPPLIPNPGDWRSRVLIGMPSRGLVRTEFMHARYGQMLPPNWSASDLLSYYQTMMIPGGGISVHDAENLIVKHAIDYGYEWLLRLDDDLIIPPDTFARLNDYMSEKTVPIVSGLYFTRHAQSSPLMFRGVGTGYYADWTLGDKVWVDLVPCGLLLIHCSILRHLWNNSEPYVCGSRESGFHVTRRVFHHPYDVSVDPRMGCMRYENTSSDLQFCQRVKQEKAFEACGWPDIQKQEYPILVDTNLFCRHIDMNGVQYPIEIPERYLRKVT